MGKEKILVVDDEQRIVDLVGAYLKKDGYRVVTAPDGRRAVEIYKRERPDLVVLDLMLPEKSGWDVCREIRTEGATPIIMLTAVDDDADKIAGLEMGAEHRACKGCGDQSARAVGRRDEQAVGDRADRPGRAGDQTLTQASGTLRWPGATTATTAMICCAPRLARLPGQSP